MFKLGIECNTVDKLIEVVNKLKKRGYYFGEDPFVSDDPNDPIDDIENNRNVLEDSINDMGKLLVVLHVDTENMRVIRGNWNKDNMDDDQYTLYFLEQLRDNNKIIDCDDNWEQQLTKKVTINFKNNKNVNK